MGDGDPRGGRGRCACPEKAWGGWGKSQSREPDRRGRAAWGARVLHPQVWKFVKPPSQLCPRTALPAARDTRTARRGPGAPKWLSDASGKPQSAHMSRGAGTSRPHSVLPGATLPRQARRHLPELGTPLQALALSPAQHVLPRLSAFAGPPSAGNTVPWPLSHVLGLSSNRRSAEAFWGHPMPTLQHPRRGSLRVTI